jgi:MFS family permease
MWSSFLAGFILWYGVDKLYLSTLGYGALAVGLAVIVLQVVAVVFEVPAGFISDGWSRTRVLRFSMSFLVAAALLMGFAQPLSDLLGLHVTLGVFLLGVVSYGLHVTTFYSTADALVYDTLLEIGEKDDMGQPIAASRLCGRLYAINLAGYAVASLIGGFYARVVHHFLDYYWVFLIAAIPAIIGLVLTWKLQEPSFRKARSKRSFKEDLTERIAQVREGSKDALASGMIKPLMYVLCLLWSVSAFREGFGQLFFLRFVPDHFVWMTPAVMASLLFGVFYAFWACGELRAYKYDGRVNKIVALSTLPFVGVGVVYMAALAMSWLCWIAFALFMMQAYYGAMLYRQISNEIHKVTTSDVRDSVMSIRSMAGRLVSCAAIVAITLILNYADMVWAVLLVAGFALAALIFWIGYTRQTSRTSEHYAPTTGREAQPQTALEEG